jgi:hypothetical protein
MTKYKVAEREVFGLKPGTVLEADEVLGLKGYDLNTLVEAGHLVVVDESTPVGPPPKPKPEVVKTAKEEAPKAKPSAKEDVK